VRGDTKDWALLVLARRREVRRDFLYILVHRPLRHRSIVLEISF
jgi:hypothetical protein